LALPALITTAEAENAITVEGVTPEQASFPSLRGSLYDSASAQTLLAAAETDAPGGTIAPPAAAPRPNPAPGPSAGAPLPPPLSPLTEDLDPDDPFAQLLGLTNEIGGPAWRVVPRVGISEHITDNANHSRRHPSAGAYTTVFGSVALRGDTPRIQTGLGYTVRYRGAGIGGSASRSSGFFSQNGSGVANAVVIPEFVFLDLRASARELQRVGYGDVNPDLLTRNESTQSYLVSGSPDIRWRMGNLGTSDLRYAYSHIWFRRNTGLVPTSTGTLAPLSDAAIQFARYDFRMPETVIARLNTDLSAYGSEQDIGSGLRRFKRGTAQMVNEYQFSPSLSAIATGGYESLSSSTFPSANGQGPTWDLGGRWRPNVDSSVVILYGSHDLKTSIRGEASYHLSPLTTIYLAYVNGITTSQGALASSGGNAFFGGGGALSSIGFEDDLTIGGLNGGGLGFGGFGAFGGSAGIPLFSSGNFSSLQNGIFRRKLFSGTVTTHIASDRVSLTVYHVERNSFASLVILGSGIGNIVPNLNATGAQVHWLHNVTGRIPVGADFGYRTNSLDDGKTWNLGVHAGYDITPTVHAMARFSSIFHDAGGGNGFTANILSISLVKTFE
jgi:uncharacterized protein (PEP-CTERM system associated)